MSLLSFFIHCLNFRQICKSLNNCYIFCWAMDYKKILGGRRPTARRQKDGQTRWLKYCCRLYISSRKLLTFCRCFGFLMIVLVVFWHFSFVLAITMTRSCFIFLETSNQYLKGARLSWVLQRSKHLPGKAEKLYTSLKTDAQNCIFTSHKFSMAWWWNTLAFRALAMPGC